MANKKKRTLYDIAAAFVLVVSFFVFAVGAGVSSATLAAVGAAGSCVSAAVSLTGHYKAPVAAKKSDRTREETASVC